MKHVRQTAKGPEIERCGDRLAKDRSIRIPSNSVARFRVEVENGLAWLESELALLSPTSKNYETEKRAIQSASNELRALIRHVMEAPK